jgi:DNA-binding NarL/FixJ family response regulator
VQESARLAQVLERLGAHPVPAGSDRLAEPEPAAAPAGGAPPPPPAAPLTAREREVLQWVAAGHQNKEIAQALGLSLATVRNHVHNILEAGAARA